MPRLTTVSGSSRPPSGLVRRCGSEVAGLAPKLSDELGEVGPDLDSVERTVRAGSHAIGAAAFLERICQSEDAGVSARPSAGALLRDVPAGAEKAGVQALPAGQDERLVPDLPDPGLSNILARLGINHYAN